MKIQSKDWRIMTMILAEKGYEMAQYD